MTDDALMSSLVDAAPAAMIAFDASGNVRVWNRAAERLLGWSGEEMRGRPFAGVPDDRAAEWDAISTRARAGETIMGFETIRVRKDGTQVAVSLSLSTLPAAEWVVLVLEDITERRRLLSRLSEAKRDLRETVDGVQDVLCRVSFRESRRGTIIFAGRRADAVMGHAAADLVRDIRVWWSSVNPEDVPAIHAAFGEMERANTPQTYTYRFRHGRTGEWIWIEERAAPTLGPDGKLLEVFLVSRDATERKRMEAALARATEERAELSKLVVHDLKSPLSTILANLRFVQREPVLSEDAKEALGDAHCAGEALGRMVLNLLDVSRAEHGDLKLDIATTSISALLAQACSEARHRLAERSQSAVLDAGEDVIAKIDADVLRRIVDNLLDNCMKYGGAGSKITVAAHAFGTTVRLSVSDEGPGIPLEMRERIFEKNVRLDRDAENHARTSRGLGLTFCRLAARAHGGDVRVEENHPRGARFVVELPHAALALAASARA